MEPKESLLRVNAVGSLGPGDRLLVLLHGYGADENDLAPLVQHIDPDGRFTSVCFRAPIDLTPSELLGMNEAPTAMSTSNCLSPL